MKISGFTLLEVIIYCALFSMLMTSSTVTVYALLGSSARTAQSTSNVAEATFINQKLNWAFFGATDVELIDSKTIKIVRSDLSIDSPLTINEVGGVLYLMRGTASPVRLTGDQFMVTGVQMSVTGNRVLIDYQIGDTPLRFETYIN